MKVGFIHATTTAVEPINQVFREIFPEAARLHFMDTGLLTLLQSEGELTPGIIRRLYKLAETAEESGVDCIQFTCSAFNDATAVLQPLFSTKLMRSDEAMLDEAVKYQKIGLVSTVEETPAALGNYIKAKNPHAQIHSLVEPKAIQFLFDGNQAEHDFLVIEMVKKHLQSEVDVIVLSQYSMAHVADQIPQTAIPILSAPKASARKCLQYVRQLNKTGIDDKE